MKNAQIRTRFAPSPTGLLHLGNVRTALFSWLFAKLHSGSFILRIEDTDKVRSSPRYITQMLEDLRWLDLNWQEGPDCGGDYGPYVQSERQVIYDEFYQRLEVESHVYPCFCSDEQLVFSRKTQLSAGLPPRYAGTCRSLTYHEVQKKRAVGLAPTLRFRVAGDGVISFKDVLKGDQQFRCSDIGDFIIRRADGTSPFLFCNAIDDALMHITHVIRGDDHLANTPRQLMILKALGLPIPHYVHIPLIVGVGGAPLSKREGSFSLKSMREEGYFKEAIINQLARLGHTYESHEMLSVQDLAAAFSLNRIAFSAAHFDEVQLRHWQKACVLKRNVRALWDWLSPSLEVDLPEDKQNAFVEWVRPNVVFPKEARVWAKCLMDDEISFSEEGRSVLKHTQAQLFDWVAEALQAPTSSFKEILESVGTRLNIKGMALYQPVRVALTGQLHGPALQPLLDLLGCKRAALRIQKAALSIC